MIDKIEEFGLKILEKIGLKKLKKKRDFVF